MGVVEYDVTADLVAREDDLVGVLPALHLLVAVDFGYLRRSAVSHALPRNYQCVVCREAGSADDAVLDVVGDVIEQPRVDDAAPRVAILLDYLLDVVDVLVIPLTKRRVTGAILVGSAVERSIGEQQQLP